MTNELAPGREIGRYVLDKYVGGGGFGSAWRAHDTSSGADVAVKFLTGDYTANTAAIRAEVELLAASAASRSEHVVRVLGGGDEPVPHIVMEYIDGTDLAGLLRDKGKLPLDQTLEIGLAVADALRALNEAGIVHRDIKPANVMMDQTGKIKLADFGIAKIVGYETVTMTGQIALTMAYAAPEVWDEEDVAFGHPSHKSDLYALGTLLYQCLMGSTPFQGSYGTLYKAHRERPPNIASLPAEAPASLREIVRHCLAKRQADRGSGFRNAYIQRGGFLRAAEFPGPIGGTVAAFLGHVGIELERVPMDRKRQPLLRQHRQSTLQLPLADIAPRADRIRHDVDARANGRFRAERGRGCDIVAAIRSANGAGGNGLIHGLVLLCLGAA